jgi:glycosyltransferase involved in cell wall biosynthesis
VGPARTRRGYDAAAVKLCVVICTRNRAASLGRALDSLALALPPRRASWETVVVDNGSSDDTQAVIARFHERLPLRAEIEPEPGISHARNRGVGLADGDYVLWTDDDVTHCRGWLQHYESAFEANPGAAFFGGPIRPRFVGTPPRWLQQGLFSVRSAYAALEVTEPARPLDASSASLPYSANMAVRGDVQQRYPFDLRLGRNPHRPLYLSGEETDVLRRIAADGGTGLWVPEASVEHWIEPARQSPAYLRRYYEGIGYASARRRLEQGTPLRRGGSLRLRHRMAWKYAAYLLARACGRSAAWLRALRHGAALRGRLIAREEALAAMTGDAAP